MSDNRRMSDNDWRKHNPERQELMELLWTIDADVQEIQRAVREASTRDLERAMWRAQNLATRFRDIGEKLGELRAAGKEVISA